MELMKPGYSNYPESFRTLITFLLASLVYHDKWLHETLLDHPLFLARVYTAGFVTRLTGKVLLGISCCPVTKMTATGVPTHIMLARDNQEFKRKLEEINEGMLSRKEDVINAVKV